MPLTALRIFPSAGDRALAVRSDVVRWTVPTRDTMAAYEAEGIPQDGDRHPDDPKLFLDRRTADSDGANTEVTGYYSTNGRYRGQITVEKQEGWYKFAPLRVRKTTVDIPFNLLANDVVPGIDGGPGTTREVWTPRILKRDLKLRQYRLDVYTKVPNRSSLDFAAGMVDHLHRIQGRDVLFMGMTNAQEEGADFWTLTYEWEGDPGTEWPEPRQTDKALFLSPDYRAPDARLIRLPYEQLFHTSSEDPENIPISCDGVAYPPDLRFPSEWRTLPGMPPL